MFIYTDSFNIFEMNTLYFCLEKRPFEVIYSILGDNPYVSIPIKEFVYYFQENKKQKSLYDIKGNKFPEPLRLII